MVCSGKGGCLGTVWIVYMRSDPIFLSILAGARARRKEN